MKAKADLRGLPAQRLGKADKDPAEPQQIESTGAQPSGTYRRPS
jgi:hypothetical protein